MHTLKPKHLSKPITIALIAGLAIIIVGGGVGAYYLTRKHDTTQPNSPTPQQSSSSKINNEAPTATQKQAGDQQKQSIITNDQQQSTAPSTLTVSYTATNQSGSTIYIRSLIANAITNNGSCTLTLTNGSNTSVQTSGTQALADSSTCKGFNIPSSTLPTGTWHLHLVVTVDNRSGSADKDLIVN